MSLFDSVQEQRIPCKVPGCKNLWILTAQEVVEGWRIPGYTVPRRMCSSCKSKLDATTDQQISCATKDCTETVLVPAYQQLVLHHKHKNYQLERRFCRSCQERLASLESQEIPCRMKSCSHTWSWHPSSQLIEGGLELKGLPESRLCPTCFSQLKNFSDQQVPCSVEGCSHTWLLNRMSQLELFLTQKRVFPRKCTPCINVLKKLNDMERPCLTVGCSRTWKWSTYSQLVFHHQQAENPSVTEPQRHCEVCLGLLKRLEAKQIGCYCPSCSRKISYSVTYQLEDQARHQKPRDRHLWCESCQKIRSQLQDRSQACQQTGCQNAWTWGIEEQFKEGHYQEEVFHFAPIPKKSCERCHDFLMTHKNEEVDCLDCDHKIPWTPRQQLMSELGQWVKPTRCPQCIIRG